jgi:hypothetical protein
VAEIDHDAVAVGKRWPHGTAHHGHEPHRRGLGAELVLDEPLRQMPGRDGPCGNVARFSDLFAPVRIVYVRVMFHKLPLADSLEHVADADELTEWRQVQRGGLFSGLPGSFVLGAPALTGLKRELWLRAREHLISGDWDASAFKSGNTVDQKWLHKDIWRFLEPDRSLTRVTGGGFDFCGILVSGRVSSLVGIGDQPPELDADEPDAVAADDHPEDGDAPTRARLCRKIKALFERLDKELPLHECKPAFFARAQEELGPKLSEYILSQAWGIAEVNSERRKPGVRKLIE